MTTDYPPCEWNGCDRESIIAIIEAGEVWLCGEHHEQWCEGWHQPMGWWTISGERLLELLRRAHAGESPDLIYAEEYMNSEVTRPNG